MINSIKKFRNQHNGLLVRIDDVAENMNWTLMNKCEILFDQYNIKPLLGVIPCNEDRELYTYEKNNDFWNKVRSWQKKGWEISMHGFSHVYDQETNKKDYFNYGGKSEFYGHSYSVQTSRIKKALKKFNDEKINIRSFFAPNHTYDKNTFTALKDLGIKNIIDGYGLIPYTEHDLNFVPQLFYKEIMLPFGIQSTQIHLNYWSDKYYNNFETFILKNKNKIINFEKCIEKVNNNFFSKIINFSTKTVIKSLRRFR
jgi:predicted deacetylase